MAMRIWWMGLNAAELVWGLSGRRKSQTRAASRSMTPASLWGTARKSA